MITLAVVLPDATSSGTFAQPNELHLMHQWCTRTCNSFTPRFAGLCREYVPREAFRHGYLLDALLAITTLHIASDVCDENIVLRYISAAFRYQNQSMAGLNRTLGDISPDNVDAVVLSSVFIMICAVLSPLLPATPGDQIESTADAIIPLVHLLKGIGSIINDHREWLVQGPFVYWFRAGALTIREVGIYDPGYGFQLLNESIATNTNTGPLESVLQTAIDHLKQTFSSGGSMLRWLSTVEPEYLEQLRKKRGAALAIFMLWGVLLSQEDDMWWATYSGKRLVENVSARLDACAGEWKQVTHWCREQTGLLSYNT